MLRLCSKMDAARMIRIRGRLSENLVLIPKRAQGLLMYPVLRFINVSVSLAHWPLGKKASQLN